MALKAIIEALGVDRVIWVDDVFGKTDDELVRLAMEHPDLGEQFPELLDALDLRGFPDAFYEALRDAIDDLSIPRLGELRVKLLQADAEAEGAPAEELDRTTIENACKRLGVAKTDRWSFDDADKKLATEFGDDTSVAYIIDLKDAEGKAERGLDAIGLLRKGGSKGVAFILTHETTAANEADLESKLSQELGEAKDVPPLTVISKGRLTEENADVEAALCIALKRAGIRRALNQVVTKAATRGAEAYAATSTALLEVEPERLERYVYEQGRREGISELSVVERALSAGASKEMRTFFGTDSIVRAAVNSLRALQSVELDQKPSGAGPILSALRDAEVWDDGDLINTSLTPLANGDVFQFDGAEPDCPKTAKSFVLIGQPCDIALRADGSRVCEFAMFVPLKSVDEDGNPLPDPNEPDEDDAVKTPVLPFKMGGGHFKLNIRDMTYARLSILDLATFRTDGCVRVEAKHSAPAEMLAGAKLIYPSRTQSADDALAVAVPSAPVAGVRAPIDDRLMLTMSEGKVWGRVRVGRRLGPFKPGKGQSLAALPDRVTWTLRREGRIRAPYSAFLLERTLRTLGRRAFDSDFTKDTQAG